LLKKRPKSTVFFKYRDTHLAAVKWVVVAAFIC